MEPENRPTIQGKRTLFDQLKLQLDPEPIEEPKVHSDLTGMNPLERAVEVTRYSVLRFEWWLSRSGALREWLRWNLLIAIVLTIPALMVVPVITFLLGQFATWSGLLVQIAKNLVIFPLLAIICIALFSALLTLIRRGVRR